MICFAPADAPRYAMSILVEHGGHGGVVCAPIARDVMMYLFEPEVALASLARIRGDAKRRADVEARARAAAARRAAAPVAA